jgi:bifunctional NMN adenylyltransferase/nudix hydrolase
MDYDILTFIGRFQPFHLQHKRIIDIALKTANQVLILVGSAGSARTIRNPFTFEERKNMILGSFDTEQASRLLIEPVFDMTYNDSAWIKQIQEIVKSKTLDVINSGGIGLHGLADARIGLIGASKDHTSYYLKMFPQFDSVDVPITYSTHATTIREGFLDGTMKKHELYSNAISPHVAHFMYDEFAHTNHYEKLRAELDFVRQYQRSWKSAPYPVKHVTVDAVVEQGGHILLVRRKSEPGKGLWALPGGHLNEFERIEDGIIRELREETGIKVPVPVLKGSIVKTDVFDDPHRSTLGRVITHAAHIILTNELKLPKVKGADDADKAKWVPISELREDMMFDDHYAIVQFFLGL